MTVTVRYIGTTNPYFETAVTGKPGKWTPGDTGDVSDTDAALLIGSGLFEVFSDRLLPFAFDASGAIAGVRLPSGAVFPVAGGGAGVSSAQFAVLAAASGLTPGSVYYLSDLPAMWLAITTNTYVGVAFVKDGIEYIGDQARAPETEKDLGAGTWATRQLTGFTAGVQYYRRMTDIGTVPGGCVMTWFGGTSTEWRVQGPVDVFNDYTTVTGEKNTTEQALNPKDLPAGILNACGEFEIILVAGKNGTTDGVDSIKARLGADGTTADTVLNGVASTAVAAGDRCRSTKFRYRVKDASNIQATDSQLSNTGYYGSATSSGAAFPSYAVVAANALKLSCNVKLGTAGTDSPQCLRTCLRLLP